MSLPQASHVPCQHLWTWGGLPTGRLVSRRISGPRYSTEGSSGGELAHGRRCGDLLSLNHSHTGQTLEHFSSPGLASFACPSGSPSQVPGPAASASLGNLLAMELPEPHPRLSESGTEGGAEPRARTSPPGDADAHSLGTTGLTCGEHSAAGPRCVSTESFLRGLRSLGSE